MNRFFYAACLVASMALAPAVSQAQSTEILAPYTGPRYPGGPDSLRALVYRSSHLAPTNTKDLVVVQLELKADNTPGTFRLVGDQWGPKSATGRAAAASLEYLQARLLPWEASIPGAQAKQRVKPVFLLPLNFTAPLSAQPYAYVDREPVFGYTEYLRPQLNARADNSPNAANVMGRIEALCNSSLATYIPRQPRYSAVTLRTRAPGWVLVYFEVAETGVIENPRILTSANGTLASEVLGAMRRLQPAAIPAQLNGQPARVFYVLPMSFSI